jgi:uncharacterized protein YggE
MTQPSSAIITVRGRAEAMVAPDRGVLHGAVRTIADDKPEALRAAAAMLAQIQSDLGALGGVVRTVETERHPLTWSALAARTNPEWDESGKGGGGQTGRIIAAVELSISVRDFAMLDDVGAVLAAHSGYDTTYVQWEVDSDNPAWRDARAAAIRDAIEIGRHYATALGGRLQEIEQIADAGLLDTGARQLSDRVASAHALGFAPDASAPSLDPVPQVVSAAIDARFTARVDAL